MLVGEGGDKFWLVQITDTKNNYMEDNSKKNLQVVVTLSKAMSG